MKKVKMIWDFRGTNAYPIAKHHTVHLEEFLAHESIEGAFTGTEHISPTYYTAYLVVPESRVNDLRNRLKPHRGQWYEPKS